MKIIHDSDCAVHNEPAYPNGPCDCGTEPVAYLTRWRATKNEPIDSNPWVAVEAVNYTPNPGKDAIPLYIKCGARK